MALGGTLRARSFYTHLITQKIDQKKLGKNVFLFCFFLVPCTRVHILVVTTHFYMEGGVDRHTCTHARQPEGEAAEAHAAHKATTAARVCEGVNQTQLGLSTRSSDKPKAFAVFFSSS